MTFSAGETHEKRVKRPVIALLILLLLIAALVIFRQFLHIEEAKDGTTRIAWKSTVKKHKRRDEGIKEEVHVDDIRERRHGGTIRTAFDTTGRADVIRSLVQKELQGQRVSKRFFWRDTGRPLTPGDVITIDEDMEIHELPSRPGEPKRWVIGKRTR